MIKRAGEELNAEEDVVLGRIKGILNARHYVMLDYNVAKTKLSAVEAVTPGLTGPTISPLAREGWVAVRVMVPRKQANQVMDDLSALGGEAILASDLRIARF